MRLLWILVALPAIAQVDLKAAYKKEHSFLEAELRTLEARLAGVKSAAAADEKRLQQRLAALQAQVVATTAKADARADELRQLEREAEGVAEGGLALDGLVTQVARAFETYGSRWTPPKVGGDARAATAARLADAFRQVGRLVEARGVPRVEDGSFFLADGTKVDGKVVRLGGFASFGASGEHAGALVPAGGGALKLTGPRGAEAARALASNGSVAGLDLFLYESVDTAWEPRKQKTALEIVESGGAIAWVIVYLGAFAALLLLVRLALLVAGALSAGRFGAEVRALLAANAHRSRTARESMLSERLVAREAALERLGTAIAVIAAVAPLLGLLGTVTGMISTFDVITEHGTGNPKLLSGGISEALVTTELGLCVAIPALLLGSLLGGWANRINLQLEQSALAALNEDAAPPEPAEKPVDEAEELDPVLAAAS